MEDSHHINRNSIIYRKRAIHRTEIERPFLAAEGFDTNLIQFLLPYHVIISDVYVCSFMARFTMWMDMHRKWFCMHKISCMKNYNLWRPGYTGTFPRTIIYYRFWHKDWVLRHGQRSFHMPKTYSMQLGIWNELWTPRRSKTEPWWGLETTWNHINWSNNWTNIIEKQSKMNT